MTNSQSAICFCDFFSFEHTTQSSRLNKSCFFSFFLSFFFFSTSLHTQQLLIKLCEEMKVSLETEDMDTSTKHSLVKEKIDTMTKILCENDRLKVWVSPFHHFIPLLFISISFFPSFVHSFILLFFLFLFLFSFFFFLFSPPDERKFGKVDFTPPS